MRWQSACASNTVRHRRRPLRPQLWLCQWRGDQPLAMNAWWRVADDEALVQRIDTGDRTNWQRDDGPATEHRTHRPRPSELLERLMTWLLTETTCQSQTRPSDAAREGAYGATEMKWNEMTWRSRALAFILFRCCRSARGFSFRRPYTAQRMKTKLLSFNSPK